jgi:hypothetical protein
MWSETAYYFTLKQKITVVDPGGLSLILVNISPLWRLNERIAFLSPSTKPPLSNILIYYHHIWKEFSFKCCTHTYVDAFSQCYESGSALILVGFPVRIRIWEGPSDPQNRKEWRNFMFGSLVKAGFFWSKRPSRMPVDKTNCNFRPNILIFSAVKF